MNSRRYTMTSLSIVFLAITMITVSGLGQNAYAAGMSLSVDANYASGSISISGVTDRSEDVTILVTAENGNRVAVDQVTPSGGSYSTTLGLADMDGAYTVTVQQASGHAVSNYQVSVEISSSSPSKTISKALSVEDAEVAEGGCGALQCVDPAEIQGEPGLNLSATGVRGSSTIDVSGTTDRSGDITLKVIAPNGNIVSVSQITPSGGSFSAAIETGGALWTQDGMYTISAHQGDASSYQKSAQIEVVDGHVIPEFGVIAGVILAVAIASIIAVSAKSRLTLVPKY